MGNTNSCIIYQTSSQCNIQSRCTWDTSVSKCVCNSIIPQDIVIILDSSGSVQTNGWIVEKQFVISLISTAIPQSSPIGIVQFATNAWIRYELFNNQNNRSKILSTVSNLEYTRGWTYMKDAVTEAIWLFENQSLNPQKRLVLITDGNPMPVSQTPCDLRIKLDELGIDVMIIGVGASWTRARIDCLVSKDSNIIQVTEFTNDAFEINRNLTDEFLCRDVSFTLTEIKPNILFDNQYYPIPFVEFYNDIKDMDLGLYNFKIDGTFKGDITVTNIIRSIYGTNWPIHTYLVIYDNIYMNDLSSTPWCYHCICDLLQPNNHLCNESIYISIPGSYNNNNNPFWNIIIYDTTDIINRQIMNITYGMNNINDWIIIRNGYTYELIENGCDPTNGKCWKESCTVYGTPGYLPIDCDINVCSDDSICQIGGDLNGNCNLTTSLCNCNQWCYNIDNTPTCNCIFPPINCSIILNTNINSGDNTGIPSGDASWNKPLIDWSIYNEIYNVWYEIKWFTFQNDEHNIRIAKTPINQRGLTLFNMEYRTNIYQQQVRTIVNFGNNEIYESEWEICKLTTLEPTLLPTYQPTTYQPTLLPTLLPTTISPTLNPTPNPTITPSIQPTISPTYSWWILDGCIITIINNEWIFTWIESDKLFHPTLPDYRRIYIYINNIEFRILNQNQFSPQIMSFSSQIPPPDITTHVEIKLIAQHLTKNNDLISLKFSPNIAICKIITMSPTFLPTNTPITLNPTPSPIIKPSINPSISPTKSPIYNLPIDWCIVLIKDTTAYNITFKIPQYDDNNNDIKYMIIYANETGRNLISANEIGTNIQIYNELLFTNGININYNTQFKITTVNNKIYSQNWTKCIIQTINPTINPSISPSIIPTLSPNEMVGVFVYSDDETICLGYERCACHLDKNNYNCIGSDFPEQPQIENTYLYFLPSSGVQMRVLWIGRYPYYLKYNTIIQWEFIYLNNTNNFNYKQRIKPIRGITTIKANERLGEIVLGEFVPMKNEKKINYPQWYMFKIINCEIQFNDNNNNEYENNNNNNNNNDITNCGIIYPSWTYIIWVPPEAYEALLIGGGEPWPDWIFYLLLGASVTGVIVAYLGFVYFKNKNLKNNVDAQDQAAEAMLAGIGPSSNVIHTND